MFGTKNVAMRNALSKLVQKRPIVLKNPCIARNARYVKRWKMKNPPADRLRCGMKYTMILNMKIRDALNGKSANVLLSAIAAGR